MISSNPKIPILLFAESILGIRPYDWQCHILLNYEAGNQTAAACANFTGKTSTVFPIAALWTLHSFPRARLMYLSATSAQVKNQFFASLERFRHRPGLAGWTWLETEVRNPQGGFLFGRATEEITCRKRFGIGSSAAFPRRHISLPACDVAQTVLRSTNWQVDFSRQ